MAEEPVGRISNSGAEIHPAAGNTWGALSPSLRWVATGLQLVYLCIVVEMIAVIAMLAAAYGLALHQPRLMGVLTQASSWIATGISILSIVGTLLCLATPEESGAVNYVRASVAFLLLHSANTLGSLFLAEVPRVLEEVSQPADIVSSFLFVIFLRQLALFLGRPDLAARAKQVLLGGLILMALVFGPLLIGRWFSGHVASGSGVATIVLLVATLCALLFVVVKYVNLLSSLRKVICQGRMSDAL